jgi:hypothetical protein
MKAVEFISALLAIGCWAAACSTSSPSAGPGTGGVTGPGGNMALGGTTSGTGGAATATGGQGATGGAPSATGGAATGGAATGGAGMGGRATGGQTGGGVSTGGSATGGSATGGQSTGGQSGGAATGGRMTGGTTGDRGGSTGMSADGSATDLGSAMDGTADLSPPPGICSTSTGSAFTPLTDYTARDGGFGPAVITRNTGDSELGTAADGSANKVAIFRPAAAKYGQGGVTHPIVVWGNGSTNTVDIWQSFLARVATYGFVVVAPEQTQVTADHMNQAIDYVLHLATDPTSGDCGKIDTTKIGSTGYSLGGMGAITVGSNARITSTFLFASNGNVKNLKAPWGIIGGDADTTFSFTAITTAVTGSTQPAFGAALAGINHNGVAGQPKAQEGYIGWMRWRFMGDKAGHDMFVGSSCKLCTDTAFSGVVKTTTFDSL